MDKSASLYKPALPAQAHPARTTPLQQPATSTTKAMTPQAANKLSGRERMDAILRSGRTAVQPGPAQTDPQPYKFNLDTPISARTAPTQSGAHEAVSPERSHQFDMNAAARGASGHPGPGLVRDGFTSLPAAVAHARPDVAAEESRPEHAPVLDVAEAPAADAQQGATSASGAIVKPRPTAPERLAPSSARTATTLPGAPEAVNPERPHQFDRNAAVPGASAHPGREPVRDAPKRVSAKVDHARPDGAAEEFRPEHAPVLNVAEAPVADEQQDAIPASGAGAKPTPTAPERPAPTVADGSMKMKMKMRTAQLAAHVQTAKELLRLGPGPSFSTKRWEFHRDLSAFFVEGGPYDTTTVSIYDLSALGRLFEEPVSKPEYVMNEADQKLVDNARTFQKNVNELKADLKGRIEKLGQGTGAVDLWLKLDGQRESAEAFMSLVADMPAKQKIETFIAIKNAADERGRVDDPVVMSFIELFGSNAAMDLFADCASNFDRLGEAAQRAFSNALTPKNLAQIIENVLTVVDLDHLALPSNPNLPQRIPESERAGKMMKEAHKLYDEFRRLSSRDLPSFEDVMVVRLKGHGMALHSEPLVHKINGKLKTYVKAPGKPAKMTLVSMPNSLHETAKARLNPFAAKPANADEVREFRDIVKRADRELKAERQAGRAKK